MPYVPVEQSSTVDPRVLCPKRITGKTQSQSENERKRPVPVTDSGTFTTPEVSDEDLWDLLLEVLPPDGSTIRGEKAQHKINQ